MAQKSRSALKAQKNTLFADNTTGDVTPEDVRTHEEDMIDSMPNIVDEALATAVLQEVTLTSAQIKALYTTPIQIIAQSYVASDKFVDIISAVASYAYGTVDYATTTNLFLCYGPTGGVDLNTTGISISGSIDTAQKIPIDDATQNDLGSLAGQGVSIYAPSANPTAGDGELTISIVYRLVTIP